MARYTQRGMNDWLLALVQVAIVIGTLAMAIFVIYPWKGWLPTVLLIFVATLTVVRLRSRADGYKCADCGGIFQGPTVVNFFTPSGVARNPDGTYYGWKSLTCPHCGERTKAKVIKRVDMERVKAQARRQKPEKLL